jgi:hypothetical protein
MRIILWNKKVILYNNKLMKKWALVILPLLIIIIFIGLSLFRGHKRVMEPELTGFFGGIDQGMTRNQTKKIESELSSYSYDFSFYYGRSENNPILNLDLTFYDKYLIRQFIGTAEQIFSKSSRQKASPLFLSIRIGKSQSRY